MTFRIDERVRAAAHPTTNIFPMMSDLDLARLAEDMRLHGQLAPALLQKVDDELLVLDGRNRLRAAEMADLKPWVTYLEPSEDTVGRVVSANIARRHQSESQRGMTAARLTTIRRKGRPAKNASGEAIDQPQAARLCHVSRSTVQRATALLRYPVLVKAVDDGVTSVSDAYQVREAPDHAQRAALEAVTKGDADTLQEALGLPAPRRPEGRPRAADTEGRRPDAPGDPDVARRPVGVRTQAGPEDGEGTAADALPLFASAAEPRKATGADALREQARGAAADTPAELRTALDKVTGSLTRFLSDGAAVPERIRDDCHRLRDLAARIARSLDAMEVDPGQAVVDPPRKGGRPGPTDAPAPFADADPQTAPTH